ncbi:MAG: Hfq-related RNA-binding protein [Synechococcales cyanobacterium]
MELSPGTPSVRQLQAIIREQRLIELKLVVGEVLKGQLVWQDNLFLNLRSEGQSYMVSRLAIAYIQLL